ncbi:tyrosine-type recombinase/integrase [Aerobium aerolatum]|uniref:Phage integrase family protein n=1 Tax=Aquamicrobium aerolatum DSM 21857 TaxID=1121003 RepID=A0A1I3RN57_9HYPH|nr:tyrosine-type recombinase/integrase [Aquamicrobium aerolatum]SFJ47480.1 Phage integrase family protein [Aquamicrobium aerolatum DSM 21857]
MARTSYLARREGRYFMQARFAVQCAPLIGKPLYRASLGTSDYRTARMRLLECLGWFHRMNDSVDYTSLFQKNVAELRAYLQDCWPISDERLFARRSYEELLKNLNRKAQAAGCGPDMIEPEFPSLFRTFVQQNVEAEAYLRKAERVRNYERGRADMQAAVQFGAVPDSFQRPLSAPPHAPRSYPIAASPMVATRAEQSSHAPERTEETATKHVPPFSAALAEYLKERREAGDSADALREVELIIQFLIDQFADVDVGSFDGGQAQELDTMLPDIPDRKNIPREHCVSLATRYAYAQKHGWTELKRLTEARIRNGYHNALSKFFGWLITKGYYPHAKPIFKEISGKNLVSLPRDSFESDEIKLMFSQPLFIGCEAPKRIWKPGTVFIQSHLYWGYIILVLHGLRISELGQIEIEDIVQRNSIYYIDLRGFDPKKGRVAIEDQKRFKTASSERLVPMHPLVIELGLLERVKELKERGCPVLFPEWEPYPKPNGELRWGQPITKSWQYLKTKIGITRADVTAYSTRHTYADFLDSTGVSHRGRMRAMGHSTKGDIPAGYGSKKRFTARDLDEILSIASPEIQFMSETLLKAKAEADEGRLTVVKPWLHRSNWSKHYREKFG